jgi:class 3 adenylate cyclase/predicted ATPase
MDVAAWLRDLGFEQYETAFRANDIGPDLLPSLTAEDLKELGVASLGHRKRLLDAVTALRAEPPGPITANAPVASAPKHPDANEAGAERRQLSVLFCDLADSTALSARLDPEDLREVIGAYHRVVTEALRRQGGYVAKFLGDGVLAYFGWPRAYEDDAERAVRAGLAATEAVRRLETTVGPLAARVGIATGPVVVGEIVGEGEARERGVVGETPNLAARLQSLAEPGAVVLDEVTRRLTGALFECADLGEAALKGVPHPVRAWRALGEGAIESRYEALRTTSTAVMPLIGRREELELLLRGWQRARAGEGQVVLLSGEAGIGKSRLAAALQAAVTASGEPHGRLDWSCSPHHQDTALHPVAARLERAARLTHEDAPGARLAKLEALLAPGDPTPEEVGLIADLLGVPTNGRDPGPDLDPRQRRERTLAALLRRVEALAGRHPVLGVFEDAHWADPTTLELLDRLVARASGLPILLLVTYRPDFHAPWAGRAHVTELRLGRLGRRDNAALVERVAGGAGALPSEVMEEIVERTDGVPLFVEEVTRAVLETGRGAAGAQATFSAAVPAALAVPAMLHASLAARLDRLGAAAKQVAQAGAAIGREFGHDLLAEVAGLPDSVLAAALRRLETADLVRRRGAPPEAVYAFRHALLRDAAYGMLLRERRRELHRRTAEAIARLHPDIAEREPEVLARHWAEAGAAEAAAGYYRRAGERSVARFANREAISHFQQALELLERLVPGEERDRLEAELRLAQAVPLTAIHGHGSEAVEACALRAVELGERLSGWEGHFAAHRLAWNSCNLRQPIPRAVALARNLLSSTEGTGELARSAVACRALGFSLFLAGELTEANLVVERGLALADGLAGGAFAAYGEDPRVVCRIHRGQIRSLTGQPETALHLAGEGLARARACGNPHVIAWSLVGGLAFIHSLLRDAAGAARAAVEATDVAERHRFPQWLGLAQQWRGWALCQLGDTEQGLALLEEGVRRLRQTGAVLHSTKAQCSLAEGCLLVGRPEAALGHVEAAHRHAEVYGERYFLAEIHRLRAEALRARGTPAEEVERHLRAALEVARRQAARLLELRAAADLTRHWQDHGRFAEARDLLAPVYAAFTEGFALPDLIEARALLEQLGRSDLT